MRHTQIAALLRVIRVAYLFLVLEVDLALDVGNLAVLGEEALKSYTQ